MDEAFSDYEKSKITTVTLNNYGNSYYSVPDGNDTDDKVFCLSLDEIDQYFKGGYNYTTSYGATNTFNKNLICSPTTTAKNNGVPWYLFGSTVQLDGYDETYFSDVPEDCVVCYWLTRTPGESGGYVCYVSIELVYGESFDVSVNNPIYSGVRPAMYIEYETE